MDAREDRVAVRRRERARDLLVHEPVDPGFDDKVGHRERLAPVVGDQSPFDQLAQRLESRCRFSWAWQVIPFATSPATR